MPYLCEILPYLAKSAYVDTTVEVYTLPFLSNKKQKSAVSQGVIVKDRTPDEMEQDEQSDSSSAGIEACAQDLIDAVLASDVKKTAQVLKDTFELLESQPHEEGPQEEGIE